MTTAVCVQLFANSTATTQPSTIETPVEAPRVVAARESLADAQRLRDEAEALTPTQVMLDETAHEQWLPTLPQLEQLAGDPQTPPELRTEVEATLAALSEVGIRR